MEFKRKVFDIEGPTRPVGEPPQEPVVIPEKEAPREVEPPSPQRGGAPPKWPKISLPRPRVSSLFEQLRRLDWWTISLGGLLVVLVILGIWLARGQGLLTFGERVRETPPPSEGPLEAALGEGEQQGEGVREALQPAPEPKPAEPARQAAVAAPKIRVANGGGIRGRASKTASLIEGAGYTVSQIVNLRPYRYTATVVRHRVAFEADAQKITDVLKKNGFRVSREQVNLTIFDIVVIVGKS